MALTRAPLLYSRRPPNLMLYETTKFCSYGLRYALIAEIENPTTGNKFLAVSVHQHSGERTAYFIQRVTEAEAPYFILDASLAEALTTAAMSGVKIEIMLSARPSGNRLPDWAGNTYIADILASGVRVFLCEIRDSPCEDHQHRFRNLFHRVREYRHP